MTFTVIFDLDKTVVDSAHRYDVKPNGDQDLEKWVEKEHLTGNDGLHPLAVKWRQIQSRNDVAIVVCTSRHAPAKPATLDFLNRQGLRVNYYLCRDEGDATPDADLKVRLLRRFFSVQPGLTPRNALMFDDHKGVRDAVFDGLGIMCLNPIPETWQSANVE